MAATLLTTVLLVASCGGTPSTTTPITTNIPTTPITTNTPTTTPPTTTPPTTTPTPTTTPPVGQCKADFVSEGLYDVLDWTTVKFNDESIGDISSWAWDFDGDGVIDSTEQNPTYDFRIGVAYEVSLTVTGDNCQDTISKLVDVTEGCGC